MQQDLRGGANHRGIDDVGLAVVAELLAGCRIENLHGRAVFVCSAGEVAGALGGRGNGGVFVKRRAAARAVPPGEEKPLVATIENFGDVQGTTDEGAELRGIVAGLRRFEAGEREGLGVEVRVVVGKINRAMRLVDVQTARQANGDRSAATKTAGPTSSTARPTALTAGDEPFALGALAKFLYAVLQIFFASRAKILCAPLRAGNADGFAGAVGTRAIHGEAGDVTSARAATLCAAGRAQRSTRERRKRIFDRQTLKSAPSGDRGNRAGRGSLLLLLARNEDQLGIEFTGRRLGLESNFLCLRREAHELHANDVSPSRKTGEAVGAVRCRSDGEFLSGERVCGGDGDARQWCLPGTQGTAYLKRIRLGRRRNRRSLCAHACFRWRRWRGLRRARILRMRGTNHRKYQQEQRYVATQFQC